MTAYAIAQVNSVRFNAEIVEYLLRIDATARRPVRREVHRPRPRRPARDGRHLGRRRDDRHRVPVKMDAATAWWDSPAYREILPLRTRHMDADIILVEGVPAGCRAERRGEGAGAPPEASGLPYFSGSRAAARCSCRVRASVCRPAASASWR
ncbi:DUF1330 domain-containing protein [Yinghuangia aomiensis]